jgi:hypothetical protein
MEVGAFFLQKDFFFFVHEMAGTGKIVYLFIKSNKVVDFLDLYTLCKTDIGHVFLVSLCFHKHCEYLGFLSLFNQTKK